MRSLKRCLGVDLGASSVKIVELAIEGTSVKVLRAASADTGADPTMPLEERRAAIIAAARDLIKKSKFSTNNAIFGLSGLKVFIRRFRLPATSPERLERIVLFEARQQIPFPLDKTELQYQFFPVEGGAEVDVLLVAVRLDEVRDYMALVDKCGLKALAVGVTSFSLFNAHAIMRLDPARLAKRIESLGAKKKGAKGAAPAADEGFVAEEVKGYVNIGAGSYDLAIARLANDATLGFTRTPPLGGNDFSRAIMEELAVNSFHDAESIKKSSARLMTFDFGFEESEEVNEQACMAVGQAAERVVAELRRSLDFYISQPDGMAVDVVEISGGQALMPGIESFMEEKLTVPCVIVRTPPENSGFQWSDALGPMTPYVVASGYALQGLGLSTITVDFLPRDKKVVRDFPYRSVVVMAVLVLLIVGATANVGQKRAERYSQQAQNLEIQIRERQRQLEASRTAGEENRAEADRFVKLGRAFGQRDYWLQFLAKVARVKPVDVLITNISMDHDGLVVIRGLSESSSSPAQFVNALKELVPVSSQLPEITAFDNRAKDPRYERPEITSFEIRFNTGDKVNHLRVTPTPEASPAANSGATPRATPRGRGGR
ncbi:MAG: pilus assembly protein PilM [Candidatus Sumerlaeia bacterium]|nr:pilus assembly protein PilM [Candidatus Sumerlaeia bacterium]